MSISQTTLQDWVKNKKRIKDRLNRIKKRITKYTKQEKHFQYRLRVVEQYEKDNLKK